MHAVGVQAIVLVKMEKKTAHLKCKQHVTDGILVHMNSGASLSQTAHECMHMYIHPNLDGVC